MHIYAHKHVIYTTRLWSRFHKITISFERYNIMYDSFISTKIGQYIGLQSTHPNRLNVNNMINLKIL